MSQTSVSRKQTGLGTLTKKNEKRYDARRAKFKGVLSRRRKGVPKPLPRFEDTNSDYLSVSALTRVRPVTKGTVYEWIHTEPTFPWLNIGLKKKLVVSLSKFDEWIIGRSESLKAALTGVPLLSSLKSKLARKKE